MTAPSTRVAIVTGAAQGIGLSIALRFADDGLDVAVNDIAPKSSKLEEVVSQIRAKGRRSLALPGDVSNEEEVKAMVARVVEELGGIDVARVLKQEESVRHKHWHDELNLLAYLTFTPLSGTTSLAAYSATKFAVRGLTQTVALELAPHRITVNAYAPGFIITDLAYHPDDTKNGGKPGSTVKKLFGLPLDSPEAGPETVASMVSYLASPESHFVTVNGGILMD
ncbi:hypothetical protein EVJ58_g8926 [Rhodofomes roseus]|uniref:3-oxoacyl-[acyl-carrier protein] reductase n=1 Tax=Rhodofomes roseus TaxID=34475 RepID=A0A4Y9XYV3_9APHY|nr:hypothetical protein EVJ58_g8926 [Rhodofomes roseus]